MCRCLCHGQMLLSDPPQPASKYCKECDCNKEHTMTINELPPYHHVCPNPADHLKKEQLITIKKSLWDEMLEYKKKIDIQDKHRIKLWESVDDFMRKYKLINERVDKLKEDFLLNNKFMDDFNKRIEKLEQFKEFMKTYNFIRPEWEEYELNKDK